MQCRRVAGAIVCSSASRRPPLRCFVCGVVLPPGFGALCDEPFDPQSLRHEHGKGDAVDVAERHRTRTCSRALCPRCRVRASPQEDYCPEHALFERGAGDLAVIRCGLHAPARGFGEWLLDGWGFVDRRQYAERPCCGVCEPGAPAPKSAQMSLFGPSEENGADG